MLQEGIQLRFFWFAVATSMATMFQNVNGRPGEGACIQKFTLSLTLVLSLTTTQILINKKAQDQNKPETRRQHFV